MDKCYVSIIIPIYNGDKWIDRCFHSILSQTLTTNIEICVCNDGSTDNTALLLDKWKQIFEAKDVMIRIYNQETGRPKGVGYGKNRAVEISTGEYLCFQDIDDVMLPDRILKQYNYAKRLPDSVLIGSQFKREPEDSTVRYTKWANLLTKKQLNTQIYTSHGPTIIMPTWFCHRNVFNRVGGFCEDGKGTPEDLMFFYKHLDQNGTIERVNETLLIYQYHPSATTFSINEQTIWDIRLERLQNKVISGWKEFTIWNGGKQGRRFFRSLSRENQEKVIAFCDVDFKKIGKDYVPFDEETRIVGRKIPIVDYRKARKPFVICVKQDMTEGQFEENLKSLNLEEGEDFIYFS